MWPWISTVWLWCRAQCRAEEAGMREKLLGLLVSLGTDGLKVRKTCADANAVCCHAESCEHHS
ncbi:hypothetical protein E2562_029139 [Oryza meyeriana var. granulata]|uniref:Hydrophobic seed protein domain-containing protein n=1 Tax=Oryza meyeriana var. granulata TaxID=110450 RepID=A0A6G1EC57_9ORYZ|nr:hypothetical protein E2562_029139 [Oryza meyeriana var. granulata]